MNISEKAKLLSEGVVKIQEEDLRQVMDDLGITLEEAKNKIQIVHCKQYTSGVEYMISDIDSLEVYKHRQIDFGLYSSYRGYFE